MRAGGRAAGTSTPRWMAACRTRAATTTRRCLCSGCAPAWRKGAAAVCCVRWSDGPWRRQQKESFQLQCDMVARERHQGLGYTGSWVACACASACHAPWSTLVPMCRTDLRGTEGVCGACCSPACASIKHFLNPMRYVGSSHMAAKGWPNALRTCRCPTRWRTPLGRLRRRATYATCCPSATASRRARPIWCASPSCVSLL